MRYQNELQIPAWLLADAADLCPATGWSAAASVALTLVAHASPLVADSVVLHEAHVLYQVDSQ